MIEAEGLPKVLPGVESISEGSSSYETSSFKVPTSLEVLIY